VHPQRLRSGSPLDVGRCTYRVVSDGRAPNEAQPRYSADRNLYYL